MQTLQLPINYKIKEKRRENLLSFEFNVETMRLIVHKPAGNLWKVRSGKEMYETEPDNGKHGTYTLAH